MRFSQSSIAVLPGEMEKPLGDDWEEVLSFILQKWSHETYLLKERVLKTEQDFHYQINAQASSLLLRKLSTGRLPL